MKVCERCLRAVESKEGKQATIEIGGSDEAAAASLPHGLSTYQTYIHSILQQLYQTTMKGHNR